MFFSMRGVFYLITAITSRLIDEQFNSKVEFRKDI